MIAISEQLRQRDLPRWEWEVGEWRYAERPWKTRIDLSESELSVAFASVHDVNDRVFCGVSPGCIQFTGLAWEVSLDELAHCTITLMEHRGDRGSRQIVDPGALPHFIEPFRQTNFYDLFPGRHAVEEMWWDGVSIEEKEVC